MNSNSGTLLLPENLREELKKPLGEIVSDAKELAKDKTIICVGDLACDHVLKAGFLPLVCVYDNKSKRQDIKPRQSIIDYAATEVEIKNPAGELTREAFTAIWEAIESHQRTKILVDGEEDLLTLAAVVEAEEDSIVVYGQPKEGLCAVNVNEEVKNKVKSLLDEMR